MFTIATLKYTAGICREGFLLSLGVHKSNASGIIMYPGTKNGKVKDGSGKPIAGVVFNSREINSNLNLTAAFGNKKLHDIKQKDF